MKTASSTAFFALSKRSAPPELPAASHVYWFLPARVTLPSFCFPSQEACPWYARSQNGVCFFFLDVGFNGLPVLPHPVAPAFGFAGVHQELEGGARLLELAGVELHAHQAPRVRVHRRFPELLGAHLA